MSFLEKLFGKRDKSAAPPPTSEGPQSLPPAPQEQPGEKRLSLQVLFGPLADSALDPAKFVGILQGLHSTMAAARFDHEKDGTAGTLSWGPHKIETHIRSRQLPKEYIHRCIDTAYYKPEQKEAARQHRAYVLLYHQGGEVSRWDQYAALGAAAAALSRQGAVAITNAFAPSSIPANQMDQIFKVPDAWLMLQNMPPAMLYMGFMKYRIPRNEKVWMRTHGGHLLGVPDLARMVENDKGNQTFNLLNAVLMQIHKSGEKPIDGGTMQLGPHILVRFTRPGPRDFALECPGEMFVVEPEEVGTPPTTTSVEVPK
jgi:hypothetical protein